MGIGNLACCIAGKLIPNKQWKHKTTKAQLTSLPRRILWSWKTYLDFKTIPHGKNLGRKYPWMTRMAVSTLSRPRAYLGSIDNFRLCVHICLECHIGEMFHPSLLPPDLWHDLVGMVVCFHHNGLSDYQPRCFAALLQTA